MELHPLDQFKIEPLIPIHLGGIDASFTNSALLMVITVAVASLVVIWGSRGRALVPTRLQSLAEISYEFIAGMIDDNVGHEGRAYFPFVFSLFMFIFFGNLLGLIPYGYTFTGQIVVTFAMAAVVFIGVTIIGIAKHGWHFLSFFVPHGVPFVLLLLLVPIEVLSYIIRPFTLSIRLFANMMAGHTMLAIFAGFIAPLLLAAGAIKAFAVVPLGVDVLLIFLELLVAALQAYVFTILTCLYLRDAIHLH
ncbi:MAG TPA: F0F1 ATP synthase subunit A [Stellaceae bacterium]|nr:F0F1 ATP synthase subunit A [Stellaceae bacterium]